MAPLLSTVPTLAVSAIYCLWHSLQLRQLDKHKKLSERVAYLLWVMAQGVPDDPPPAPPKSRSGSRRHRSGPTVTDTDFRLE